MRFGSGGGFCGAAIHGGMILSGPAKVAGFAVGCGRTVLHGMPVGLVVAGSLLGLDGMGTAGPRRGCGSMKLGSVVGPGPEGAAMVLKAVTKFL